MEKTDKIYYSVSNGGDGSAYPVFFKTKRLADWHQENMVSGWGESCTGSLNVSYVDDHISFFFDKIFDDIEYEPETAKKYIAEFFPDGFPQFNLLPEPNNDCYASVYLEEKVVGRFYLHKDMDHYSNLLDNIRNGDF